LTSFNMAQQRLASASLKMSANPNCTSQRYWFHSHQL
jgi:hypothetical protein